MMPISMLLAAPLAAYAKFAPSPAKNFESMILPNTAHLYKAPCLPESMAGEETLAAVPIMTSDYFDEFEIGGQKQTSVPFVRTPDSQFADLAKNGFPYQPNYIEVEGLKMHYIDETGPVDSPTPDTPQATYLFLHGQPTWSYLYRKMIATLLKYPVRVIAVDLIGMGRSDKPIDLSFHKYETHVRFVKKFIQSSQHFNKSPGISGSKTGYPLKHLTSFGQDWGSVIIMRVIADIPDHFDRSVIGNGGLIHSAPSPVPKAVFDPTDGEPKPFNCNDTRTPLEMFAEWFGVSADNAGNTSGPAFAVWSNYAMTSPFFEPSEFVYGLYVIVLSQLPNIGNATVTSSGGGFVGLGRHAEQSLGQDEVNMYDIPFPTIYHKAGPRMLPSMWPAMVADPDVMAANTEAWEKLGKFEKPWMQLAGEFDTIYGTVALQQHNIQHIPGAQVHNVEHKRFANSGHYLQEHEGEDIAEHIWQFVQMTPTQF